MLVKLSFIVALAFVCLAIIASAAASTAMLGAGLTLGSITASVVGLMAIGRLRRSRVGG